MGNCKQETGARELGFHVRRNISYHMRRGEFFIRCGRGTAFVGVVFGSAAFASLATSSSAYLACGAALIVTLVSAINLVAGTARCAWLHNDLRKRYLNIWAEMLADDQQAGLSKIRRYKILIRQIEADEPHTKTPALLLACAGLELPITTHTRSNHGQLR